MEDLTERKIFLNALEVTVKIQELKEIYGDIEVVVNVQGAENNFLKRITAIEIQEGLQDEDGTFIDERVIQIICE